MKAQGMILGLPGGSRVGFLGDDLFASQGL